MRRCGNLPTYRLIPIIFANFLYYRFHFRKPSLTGLGKPNNYEQTFSNLNHTFKVYVKKTVFIISFFSLKFGFLILLHYISALTQMKKFNKIPPFYIAISAILRIG